MQGLANSAMGPFSNGLVAPAATFGTARPPGQQMPAGGSVPGVGGEQYQRLELRDQIRLRPDTYIGAATGVASDNLWMAKVVGEGNIRLECPNVHVSTAIVGISKEVFDNASDNAFRSRVENMEPGDTYVSMSPNSITVRNHGKHIPVVIHHKEGIWCPQMIFGVLLTSDNYNDSIARYKIGRNGYGVKLANIFSVYFKIVVADPVNHLLYTQQWTNGMVNMSEPVIESYQGPGFTEVTFVPDFNYFYESGHAQPVFLDCMEGYYLCRAIEMSYATNTITHFNGMTLDYRDVQKMFNAHFDGLDPTRKQLHWISEDGTQEFIVADTPDKGFSHAFVNGSPCHQGEHVNEYLRAIFDDFCVDFEKKHNKKVTVVHLKKHVSIMLRVLLEGSTIAFDGQIKKKLVKPKNLKVNLPKKITREPLKWLHLEDVLKKAFNLKTKEKKDEKLRPKRIEKVHDAVQANSANGQERLKCTLILTEGETGKTLALKGLKYFPGGMQYTGIYPLRGKVMNIERHNEEKINANKELSAILDILNADPAIDYHKEPAKCLKLRYGKIGLMMDSDYDGYHIDGLLIKFIFDRLKSLAPFEFVVIIMTPVIEGFKAGERLSFFHQKQHAKWMRQNDPAGWEFKYRKGLGGWNTDPKTLKMLFETPTVVTLAIDPTTEDILKLAFNKNFTAERKKWISAYDPNSEVEIRTPRPVTDFFMEEFRDYSKASVIRAIPRLMDGLKPVHRKILYSMIKKFSAPGKHKLIKVPQFGGFVMEKAGYHHGEQALYKTIVGMAQHYITGPNNIPLLAGEGNYGDRRLRGADASPARYLHCGLHPITRFIYRAEDEPLWEILYDDGVPVEPKELYPVIPMCLVNKCEGIATGWSTMIYPHDPRVIIEWVRQWVCEKKSKRHIPKEELEIDTASKPELVPWWRDYHGRLIRIKNEPFESYRNEGIFEHQFHTIFIREIPAEVSIQAYKQWGEDMEDLFHEKPELATFRSFSMNVEPPAIDFRIQGLSTPTLGNLNLIRTVSMSNLVLIDKDEIPKKFKYSFEIMCEWCFNRLEIYEKRKANLVKEAEEELRRITLKFLFIMDVVEGRLELRGRPRSEIIPYMEAKGYPYGKKTTGKKKKEQNQDTKAKQNGDFLSIPIGTITRERAEKLRQKVGAVEQTLAYYKSTLPEDLWLKDLQELEIEVHKLFRVPLY